MLFSFRDVSVLEYTPATKSLKTFNDQSSRGNINFCNFIPEDYRLLSEFFHKAHLHSIGQLAEEELTDYQVY